MPEFQGPTRETSIATINRLVEEFAPNGGKELRQAFDVTGLGNNPSLVRFLLDVSTALVEGSPTPSGGPPAHASGNPPQGRRSLGESLNGNSSQPQ